jgi:hypothetical protein
VSDNQGAVHIRDALDRARLARPLSFSASDLVVPLKDTTALVVLTYLITSVSLGGRGDVTSATAVTEGRPCRANLPLSLRSQSVVDGHSRLKEW